MSLLRTVDDLVSEVRSQLDEQNTDSLSTSSDILPALNRGLHYAFDIYSRRYPEPLLAYSTLDLVGGTAEYDIPENVYEDRVVKLEGKIPTGSSNTFIDIQRISFRDISEFETGTQTAVPYYFAIYGRKIRIVPTPNGSYDARMWYLRAPEKLVQQQGRINSVNSGSLYVEVDTLGSDLSTNVNNLASYVNIIDGQTGEIKSSMQIQTTTSSSSRITFRSSPSQTALLGRTISGTMASTTQVNDYVCLVQGTCVPFYGSPTDNFIIQYAVAELSKKLGNETAILEEQVLDRFEKQVSRTGYLRGNQLRIQKRNPIWGGTTTRRRVFPQSQT